jgi:hypothetical protein
MHSVEQLYLHVMKVFMKFLLCYYIIFSVAGIKCRAFLHLLGEHSTSDLQPQHRVLLYLASKTPSEMASVCDHNECLLT